MYYSRDAYCDVYNMRGSQLVCFIGVCNLNISFVSVSIMWEPNGMTWKLYLPKRLTAVTVPE